MDLNLKDKVALVTGGSRGLGRAICLGLAAEGAKVAVHYYRNLERGQNLVNEANEVAREIKARGGGEALPVAGDVGSEQDIKAMIRRVIAQFGRIDILVNNAGIWPTAYVKDMTVAEFETVLRVNLVGAFVACREVVNHLLDTKRSGRIVNVTSQAAFHGSTTGHAHYAASKGGLVTFTVSLAREVAKQQIFVNAVAPGMMETEMAADALKKGKEQYMARIPLQRIGKPEEIANVVVFLCSDRASYMTGATLDVTGGMLMR